MTFHHPSFVFRKPIPFEYRVTLPLLISKSFRKSKNRLPQFMVLRYYLVTIIARAPCDTAAAENS